MLVNETIDQALLMALMNKGVVVYIVMVVIVIVVWYISTGFKLPTQLVHSTTTINAINTTTTLTNTTTSVPANATTTILFAGSCDGFYLTTPLSNSSQEQGCIWSGGPLGVWISSGNSAYEHVTITGASNNRTYVNQTNTYQCVTFYTNFTASAQNYIVNLTTGPPRVSNVSQTCTTALIKLNTTLAPPTQVYQSVYNGNFSNGQYTGWTVQGKGFGATPLNISMANSQTSNTHCYLGQPWSNYDSMAFFATTFNCGLSVAPGNITSAPFYANSAFLNFRIISQQDANLYIEILQNGTPAIIAHYNTFNISLYGSNATSQFRNASIPLVTVIDEPIQIKVVADTLNRQTFIGVGDFSLGSRPNQDKGILNGPYNFTHQ